MKVCARSNLDRASLNQTLSRDNGIKVWTRYDSNVSRTPSLTVRQNLERAASQLTEYFGGQRARFDVPLDWGAMAPFQRAVLEATAAVPFGHLDTYAGIARRIGKPGATRAVGNALGRNPIPVIVPCHRVIRSDCDHRWLHRRARDQAPLARPRGCHSFLRAHAPSLIHSWPVTSGLLASQRSCPLNLYRWSSPRPTAGHSGQRIAGRRSDLGVMLSSGSRSRRSMEWI